MSDHPSRRRGMLGQRVHGTYGPTDQLTPAIRTATAQYPVGACRAEGALERADARLGRVRSKVPVTTFAIRPQLEHGSSRRRVSTRAARIAHPASRPASRYTRSGAR